jgi:hypothetical protein
VTRPRTLHRAREQTRRDLRGHLVAAGLAGEVATSPASTLTNCSRMVNGDHDYTFGMSDWHTTGFREAVDAVRIMCGGDPGGAEQHGAGWIDPDAALAGIERHRERLTRFAAHGGGRVLIVTGHPTGLLAHYQAIARALQRAGSELLCPLDDVFLSPSPEGPRRGLRFLDGVGAVFDGASLRHTHRADYMEAMLDDLGGGPGTVDLVIGDHGMAGAAIERGIPTLSIADVNDPALPLAQVRGRTDGVLPIDDNLAPRVFTPITDAVLDWR